MKTNRIWKAGTAVVVVAVIALGWFLGVSPMLNQAAAADATRAGVDAENAVHQQELVTLQKQFEGIDEVRDEVAELAKSIPASAEMSKFIIQLNTLAAKHGVKLESISTANSQLYSPPANALLPLDKNGKPVSVTPANFITINIVLRVSGSYSAILGFTKGLQSGDRLFLSTNLVVATSGAPATPTEEGEAPAAPQFSGEIDGMVFVLLDPNAPVVAPVDGAEEPTPAPSVTATPDPALSTADPVTP